MAFEGERSGGIAQNVTGTPVQGPRIVLGIDYGTTYTGLAWMQNADQNDPSLESLNVYRTWPEKDSQKVPSTISYSSTERGRRQWGHSIDDGSLVIRWTKLDLEPRTTVKELEVLQELMKGLELVKKLRANGNMASTDDVPRHISKDAGDVVRDYLTKVAREWYQHMRSKGRHTLDNVPLDIVITHPASWSYEALNKTFRAVVGAFQKGMFPTLRDISCTSEPEACALYTVQDMIKKDHNTLIPGECFVLCDAGGGTVDLVSYRVESIDPLKLKRVGGITGGRYGATFIDKAFLEWLHPRLENLDILPKDFGTGGHFVLMPKGRVILDRFERVKHAFDGTGGGDVQLPRGTVVTADHEFSGGSIKLTATDLKTMFESSVTGTVNLIRRQVTQVENIEDELNPYHVTNIFLAGGLAENQYLFNQVKRYADGACIQLHKADDCWSGVVQGAVLRGAGIGMDIAPRVKPCPRHYGICVAQEYANWRHNGDSAVVDSYHGRQVVPDQLVWLIRKGDVILPDKPIVSRFTITFRFTREALGAGDSIRVIFVATDMGTPPSSLSKLPRDQNEVAYMDVNLKSIPQDLISVQPGRHRAAPYCTTDATAKFEVSQSVKVRLKCGSTLVASYDTSLSVNEVSGTSRTGPPEPGVRQDQTLGAARRSLYDFRRYN